MKNSDIKEEIIKAATELIISGDGDVSSITTRSIAEKANVGIGLINYHFQTKDNLIEICVQRIIEDVIMQFRPDVDTDLNEIDRIKLIAKLVMEFLISNPSVSRISILGDFNSPKIGDNTMFTVDGLLRNYTNLGISIGKKRLLIFGLITILQALFLRKDISLECLGIDINDKKERDKLIDIYVDCILGGVMIEDFGN